MSSISFRPWRKIFRRQSPTSSLSPSNLFSGFDSASAGGIAIFGIALFFTGLFLGIMGFALDALVSTQGMIVSSGMIPVSQEEINTVHLLIIGFKSCAFFVPVGYGISYWANSTRVTPGEI